MTFSLLDVTLEEYASALADPGFAIEAIPEPKPDASA